MQLGPVHNYCKRSQTLAMVRPSLYKDHPL